jgi:hypothetical protein
LAVFAVKSMPSADSAMIIARMCDLPSQEFQEFTSI